MVENNLVLYKDDALNEIMQNIENAHIAMSEKTTPADQIKRRPDGFDYIDEGYMRNLLNKAWPIWRWEIKKYEFIGDKAICVHGRLTILDNGIERYYEAVAAHRIATNSKGYVNIGNDLKAANSDCFKVAMNRLCNIGDDVYKKQDSELLKLSNEELKELYDMCINIKDEYKKKLWIKKLKKNEITKANKESFIEIVSRQLGSEE